jgi:hypothetical protein
MGPRASHYFKMRERQGDDHKKRMVTIFHCVGYFILKANSMDKENAMKLAMLIMTLVLAAIMLT